MLMDKPYFRAADLPRDFDVASLDHRSADRMCLMVSPEHFRVDYAINPHMLDPDGRLNVIDRERARAQWETLRATYVRLGFPVTVIPGHIDFPDMVFAANQSFPFVDRRGRLRVVLSHMHAKERRGEVDFFEAFYRSAGFEILPPPVVDGDDSVEGMGDILWLPGRRLLMIGWGFRTSRACAERLAAIVGAPSVLFELRDPRFYHLDTALAPLTENSALVYRPAFTDEGFELLCKIFAELVLVEEDEAALGFACNAHCPDGVHVVIDRSSPKAITRLREFHHQVVPVDVSEFAKSGGSVFCMKMMLP